MRGGQAQGRVRFAGVAKTRIELSSTVDLFELGTPVTITTPEPSQTRERY